MMAEKNTGKPKGPKRDAKGRVSGGNPGNTGGKKGRSGRPPDWLKQLKAKGAEEATQQVNAMLKAKKLNPDQLIKVAKEFDPADKAVQVDATLTVRFE